jgi:hypothetical protein
MKEWRDKSSTFHTFCALGPRSVGSQRHLIVYHSINNPWAGNSFQTGETGGGIWSLVPGMHSPLSPPHWKFKTVLRCAAGSDLLYMEPKRQICYMAYRRQICLPYSDRWVHGGGG